MRIPLDKRLEQVTDYPYTISFVIRKRLQIDNLNELPKEKRPPFKILWYGSSEDMDAWLDKVLDTKYQDEVTIYENEIES